jgi:hypothetical protein
MILISCTLITTDEHNVLCTYDCTCILCSVAILTGCTYGKNSFMTMLYLYYDKFYILRVNLTLYESTECK